MRKAPGLEPKFQISLRWLDGAPFADLIVAAALTDFSHFRRWVKKLPSVFRIEHRCPFIRTQHNG